MRNLPRIALAAAFVAGVALGADDEAAGSKPDSTSQQERKVSCGAAGLAVTVALAYDFNVLGKVAGTYVDLAFAPPLALPEEGTNGALHTRFTSLMSGEYRIAPIKRRGSRKLRVIMTTTEPGIPPRGAFKVRFDCPAGSLVGSGSLTCRTDEVVDGAGSPMDAKLAGQVRCVVVRMEPVDSTTMTSQR